jgi:peptidoglycan/LPS O-acetylase OafA/YrhL
MEGHILGFDYLRVLAAFSVVWIHASFTNETLADVSLINSYAVPAFILISIYLLLAKCRKKQILNKVFIESLIKRIFPQYFFWTFVYLVLRFAKNYFIRDSGFELDFSSLFLGGSSVHLWFLPAILIWQLFMFFYIKLRVKLFLDFLLCLVSFALGYFLMQNDYLQKGFMNCFAIYSGYIFAAKIIFENQNYFEKKSIFYLIIAIICLVFIIISRLVIFEIFFSLSVFLFFLTHTMRLEKWIVNLSLNSFGIYLIHFFFVQLFIVLAGALKIETSTFYFTLANIIITFIASFVSSFMFRKNNYFEKII